jgi:hypothetical protein
VGQSPDSVLAAFFEVSPHAVPLSELVYFLLLPCAKAARLMTAIRCGSLRLGVQTVGIELLTHVIGEFGDNATLAPLLHTASLAILAHSTPPDRKAGGGPAEAEGEAQESEDRPMIGGPGPGAGISAEDCADLQGAYVGLYKRLARVLRTYMQRYSRAAAGASAQGRLQPAALSDFHVLINTLAVLASLLVSDLLGGSQTASAPYEGGTAPGGVADRQLFQLQARLIGTLGGILSQEGDVLNKGDWSASKVLTSWRLCCEASGKRRLPALAELGELLPDALLDGSSTALAGAHEGSPQPLDARLLLHQAAWNVLSPLVLSLAGQGPGERKPFSRAGQGQRRMPSPAPPLTPALKFLDADRPSSALLRRKPSSSSSSLSSPGPVSDSEGGEVNANKAEEWVPALNDVLFSEVTRVAGQLTAGLEAEAQTLDFLMRSKAQLVMKRPGLGHARSLSEACELRQLQGVDDNQASFSVSCWVHLPSSRPQNAVPRGDNQPGPDPPGSQHTHTLLLARALEVALPGHITEADAEGVQGVAHPGLVLVSAPGVGGEREYSLEFSTLSVKHTPDGGGAHPGQGGDQGQAARPLLEESRGAAAAGTAAPMDETRAEVAAGMASPQRRAKAETYLKHCQKEVLRVGGGGEGGALLPTGEWLSVCCVYHKGSPHSTMEVFVGGRLAGTKTVPTPSIAPICSEVMMVHQAGPGPASAPATGPGRVTGHHAPGVGVGVGVVDICYHQKALRPAEVEQLRGLGTYSTLLHAQAVRSAYTKRLLRITGCLARGRAYVAEFATINWVRLLLKLFRVGAADIRRTVLQLLRALLPAVRRPDPVHAPAALPPSDNPMCPLVATVSHKNVLSFVILLMVLPSGRCSRPRPGRPRGAG